MAQRPCRICNRSEGDLRLGSRLKRENREVSLAEIRRASIDCEICALVHECLARDSYVECLLEDENEWESAGVRVDDGGLPALGFSGLWRGALVLEVYEEGGYPEITELPKLPVPVDVSPDLTCDLAAKAISKWLEDCMEHEECKGESLFTSEVENVQGKGGDGARSIDFNTSLPKRLIRLGKEGKRARLVRTATGKTGPYAALSYVWGGNGTLKTRTYTLRRYERSIPIRKLPQTIKDAFCLAKSIGLDYIWVDALCILQGDTPKAVEDWGRESQKMGHIYSNARIVLAATRSGNVEDGLFLPRAEHHLSEDIKAQKGTMRIRRNLNHEIITSCRTKSQYWWEQHINTTFPLLSRGWAFQERMLATRIVHFTPSELVWECQKSRRCECRVVESNLYPAKNNLGSALRVCLEQIHDKRSIRQMWREIVASYSVRKLTQIEDKLPALSGIASLFEERSGDVYASGLWARALPFDLLWRCDQSGDLQIEKTRDPSWSWISVDGAVKWPVSQNTKEEQPLRYISSTTYFEADADGIQCELDENEHGRVRRGRIKVKTRLLPAKIIKVSGKVWNTTFGTEWGVQAGVSHTAPFWPDIRLPDVAFDDLSLMEVMSNISSSWEEALVVRSRCKTTDEYQRIGVAANISTGSMPWTTKQSWFDSLNYKDLILV